MKKLKLTELLRTFDKKEMKEFEKFVASPFFNKGRNYLPLLKEITRFHPDFNDAKFTKEYIYSKLYPGKKYSEKTMKNMISGLLNLGEQYLIQINLNASYLFETEMSLLHELYDRKINTLFSSKFKKLTERYKDYNNVSSIFLKDKYDIEILRKRTNAIDEGRKILFDIDNIFKYLIAYSTIESLKLCQDINILRKKMNIDYTDSLINKYFEKLNLNDFLEDIKKFDEKLYKVMRIYYLRYLTVSGFDKDDSYYYELKALINENLKIFSRGEKYNLGIFLENCIAEKIREGKTFFQTEAHETNEFRIKEGIIKFDKSEYLGVRIYRKILETALKLNKTEWAVNFIEEHLKQLPPRAIDNLKSYSYSIVSFSSGDYNKALELISKTIKYYDHNFEFASKVIKLKSLYELEYIEDIFYSLDSFRHSLKNNNTLPELSKIPFRNFMRYFEKCAKLKIQHTPETDFDKVKNEITKTERILEKDWLLEKIGELKTPIK